MLIRRHYFPQEIAKQLDMVYRPSVICIQKFGTLHLKRWSKLLFWINIKRENKNLENCPCRPCRTYLPQIDFITYCLLKRFFFYWEWGVVSVAVLMLLIYIIKLTLRISWAIWWDVFVVIIILLFKKLSLSLLFLSSLLLLCLSQFSW